MKATMLALSDTAHSKTAGCTMRPPVLRRLIVAKSTEGLMTSLNTRALCFFTAKATTGRCSRSVKDVGAMHTV